MEMVCTYGCTSLKETGNNLSSCVCSSNHRRHLRGINNESVSNHGNITIDRDTEINLHDVSGLKSSNIIGQRGIVTHDIVDCNRCGETNTLHHLLIRLIELRSLTNDEFVASGTDIDDFGTGNAKRGNSCEGLLCDISSCTEVRQR